MFDIFKIGIGPSSSHTMGPWKAVQNSLRSFLDHHAIGEIREISVELYGSLAKTGKGHAPARTPVVPPRVLYPA